MLFNIDNLEFKKINSVAKNGFSKYITFYDNVIMTVSTLERFKLSGVDIQSICIKSNASILKLDNFTQTFALFDKSDCKIFKDQLLSKLILNSLEI